MEEQIAVAFGEQSHGASKGCHSTLFGFPHNRHAAHRGSGNSSLEPDRHSISRCLDARRAFASTWCDSTLWDIYFDGYYEKPPQRYTNAVTGCDSTLWKWDVYSGGYSKEQVGVGGRAAARDLSIRGAQQTRSLQCS